MRAELALRLGDAAGALTQINLVRLSHGLTALDSVDMDVVIVERDKELVTLGMRLIDQRRFGLWHLPGDRWQYFPCFP